MQRIIHPNTDLTKPPKLPKKKSQAIKRFGKVAKEWYVTRKEWIKQNPGNNGWYCYICGTYLDINTLTLDHVIPRSRAPELRNDLNNIQPCCWLCNSAKGSKHLK